MSQRSRILLLLLMFAGTAILVGLGTWQFRRLEWKENLIAMVEQRRTMAPATLAEMERRWRETGEVDYYPVEVSGRFDHAGEQYFFTTHNGAVGWNIYTPLALDDGRVVLINRGFVPDRLRDPAKRAGGNLKGMVTVSGLARDPLSEKPNRLVPDNEPANRTYYWKSIADMARGAELEAGTLIPFFIDAGPNGVPGGLPRGGTTIIEFPNNHLQYAITWFGLALALLGVGGYFLFADREGRA